MFTGVVAVNPWSVISQSMSWTVAVSTATSRGRYTNKETIESGKEELEKVEAQLSNPQFVERAPAEKVEDLRQRASDIRQRTTALEQMAEALKS